MGIKDNIHITRKRVIHGTSCIRKMSAEERQAIKHEEESRKMKEEANKRDMMRKKREQEEERKQKEEDEIRKYRLRIEEEKRHIELEKLKDEEAALKREKERFENERLVQLERARKEEEARIISQKAQAEAERLNKEREQRIVEEQQHKQLEEQRQKEEKRIQMEKSKTEQILNDNNNNLELCKKVICRLTNEISPLQNEFDKLSQNVAILNEELIIKFDGGEEDRIQKQAKNRLLKKIEITERKLDTITLKLNTLKSELSATYETKRKCDEIEHHYRNKNTRTITIPYPFFVNVDDSNRKILTIYTDSLDDHTASILESIQHAFYKIDIQPTPVDAVDVSQGGDESKSKHMSEEEFDKNYPTCQWTQSAVSASRRNKECEICLSPLCKNTLSANIGCGGNIKTLGCGHMFHAECITPWVTKYTSSCPTCRKVV